jgi:hypothetical protein
MLELMEELFDIAKTIIPEADCAKIENNLIRLSWKANDDPKRQSKRPQPVIIEINEDFLEFVSTFNKGKLPDSLILEIRKEFTAFIIYKRSQFQPRATENREESHTPEYWIFFPET